MCAIEDWDAFSDALDESDDTTMNKLDYFRKTALSWLLEKELDQQRSIAIDKLLDKGASFVIHNQYGGALFKSAVPSGADDTYVDKIFYLACRFQTPFPKYDKYSESIFLNLCMARAGIDVKTRLSYVIFQTIDLIKRKRITPLAVVRALNALFVISPTFLSSQQTTSFQMDDFWHPVMCDLHDSVMSRLQDVPALRPQCIAAIRNHLITVQPIDRSLFKSIERLTSILPAKMLKDLSLDGTFGCEYTVYNFKQAHNFINGIIVSEVSE